MGSFDIDLQTSAPLCLRARSVCAADEPHGVTESRRHGVTKARRHEEDERTGADPQGGMTLMKKRIMHIINGQRLLHPHPMLPISAPLCLRARSVSAVDESLTESRRHEACPCTGSDLAAEIKLMRNESCRLSTASVYWIHIRCSQSPRLCASVRVRSVLRMSLSRRHGGTKQAHAQDRISRRRSS
jgi:hypothetical protein